MEVQKLYNKQTGKEVPCVQGVVERAGARGRYSAETRYEEIAGFLSKVFKYVSERTGLVPKEPTYSSSKSDFRELLNAGKTTEQKLVHLLELLSDDSFRHVIWTVTSGLYDRKFKLGEKPKEDKKTPFGLEIKLEGDEITYFVPDRAYRLDRGEQVVLYSEFLPGGLVNQAVEALTKPEEKPEDKGILVVGLQVVDDQGVVWDDALNPANHVFSDSPPQPPKDKTLEIKLPEYKIDLKRYRLSDK